MAYTDLIVWKKSMQLAKTVFRVTGTFPPSQRYVLVPQMQRAALSIVSNIAEGFRRTQKNSKILCASPMVQHLNWKRRFIFLMSLNS